MSEYPINYRMQTQRLSKRFLFIISDTGGGHRASACAVQDAMHQLYGSTAEVEMVDLFVEMDRWPFDRFPDWYPHFVSKNGLPWAVSFHLSNRVRMIKAMSRIVWPYARPAVCEVLRQHPADAIVSFHPIPNYGLQMAVRCLGWQTPLATVAVDMVTAHASWFVPGAKMYLVPTEEAKKRAVRWGIPSQRVTVTGMPTRRAFRESISISQSTARQQLGIPQNEPVVLIVGGGEGMGPLAEVVYAITQKEINLHVHVIVGRNQTLFKTLQDANLPRTVHISGFVDNMEMWMRAADVLVTKAGPNTIAEAFICSLPIILYTAVPGQEEGNITHVVNNGAGLWAPQPKLAANAVEHLIKHPNIREHMAECSGTLARPYASNEIAQKLWELVTEPGKTGKQNMLSAKQPYMQMKEN